MRTFEITFGGQAEVKISDDVINAVDDFWRKCIIDIYTPEEIAKFIAYNLIFNTLSLSCIDGFADRQDSEVEYWGLNDVEISAEEIHD